MTKNKNNKYLKDRYETCDEEIREEIGEVFSQILNVPKENIIKNINLFRNVDRRALNSLYYLGKITKEQDKISAVHALEFIYKFNKRIY